MPIYEFECMKCGHEWERIISSNQVFTQKCVRCDSSKVRILVSATAWRPDKTVAEGD